MRVGALQNAPVVGVARTARPATVAGVLRKVIGHRFDGNRDPGEGPIELRLGLEGLPGSVGGGSEDDAPDQEALQDGAGLGGGLAEEAALLGLAALDPFVREARVFHRVTDRICGRTPR